MRFLEEPLLVILQNLTSVVIMQETKLVLALEMAVLFQNSYVVLLA